MGMHDFWLDREKAIADGEARRKGEDRDPDRPSRQELEFDDWIARGRPEEGPEEESEYQDPSSTSESPEEEPEFPDFIDFDRSNGA